MHCPWAKTNVWRVKYYGFRYNLSPYQSTFTTVKILSKKKPLDSPYSNRACSGLGVGYQWQQAEVPSISGRRVGQGESGVGGLLEERESSAIGIHLWYLYTCTTSFFFYLVGFCFSDLTCLYKKLLTWCTEQHLIISPHTRKSMPV